MATAKYMLPVLHRIDNAVGGLVFIVQHSRSFAAATLVFLRNDRLHEHFLDVLQCLQVEFLAGRLESFIVSDTFGSSFAAVELWAKNRQEYSEAPRFTHAETLRKHLSERLLHMYPRRSSLSSIMQTEEEEQSSGSSYLEATFFRQQASAMVSRMVPCQSSHSSWLLESLLQHLQVHSAEADEPLPDRRQRQHSAGLCGHRSHLPP
ncbi:MAG: hypothetical protein KVP17_001643 [Porospora cf. gigantea B]|uniref:uncharacterized protein n=1 Tax=Porospora cf. gigantea B TaxID=2853592 RepID=UPI003571B817|nr:MAG: hypothetical protein KVP17_001643 [Porospora cf. gigantea B]